MSTANILSQLQDNDNRNRFASANLALLERASSKSKLVDEQLGGKCHKCDGCPGFELHFWRKICRNCKCKREDHDVAVEKQEEDGLEPSWLLMIVHGSVADKSTSQTASEVKARKLMFRQRPAYDHQPQTLMSSDGAKMFDAYTTIREKSNHKGTVSSLNNDFSKNSMPITHICQICDQAIDEVAVQFKLAGESNVVMCHPNCIKCTDCAQKIVNFEVYFQENEMFCGRCHANRLLPRCGGCDELIFDPEYTIAEEKPWHLDHFCCWQCDLDICEQEYIQDGDHIFCTPCYNSFVAPKCLTCNVRITADMTSVSVGTHSVHASPDCYKCSTCHQQLQEKRCLMNKNKEALLCEFCYLKETLIAEGNCQRCNLAIKGGEYYVTENRKYHTYCFKCAECQKSFQQHGADNSSQESPFFINGRLLCTAHAVKASNSAPNSEVCTNVTGSDV